MLRLLAALTLSCATAQPLQFEVASVKLAGPNSTRNFDGGPGTRNPESFVATSATMRDLVARAYGVAFYQIANKQSLDDLYDVRLIIPPGTTKPQFQEMLRHLLAERFRLKVTIDQKEFPAYELVVAKSGLKVKESNDAAPLPIPAGFPQLPPGIPAWASLNTIVEKRELFRLSARQQPLSVLATLGTRYTPNKEPIVDRTGLTSKYDFFLEHASDSPSTDTQTLAPAASLFTAVREQLGLELISKKIPFDYVTVESFDRVPSEN